jgi:serine/threonine protein kinase
MNPKVAWANVDANESGLKDTSVPGAYSNRPGELAGVTISSKQAPSSDSAREDSGPARTSRVDVEAGVPFVADHKLLRRIGSGACGEVWLARSLTGAYRAVKIIYGKNFRDPRPYEREFRAIKKFEPISRTHDSQVDILQVGRNDGEGYYYYVMELADPAQAKVQSEGSKVQSRKPIADIHPEAYVPKTLKIELATHGRLPLEECIEIGLALTTALGHLHENGLVHRDVKPSNIVFIGGKPKLADIGLVTDLDATASFVGTEGYIPPEGPGTAQADVYGLGKVLYEISTGKDRQDFPEPSTSWEHSTDEAALRDFHVLLLRACDPDTRQRYKTAAALREDLLSLQAGKSLKRLHLLEKRVKRATRVGFVAALVAVVAATASIIARKEALRSRELADLRLKLLEQANAARAEEVRLRGDEQKLIQILETSLDREGLTVRSGYDKSIPISLAGLMSHHVADELRGQHSLDKALAFANLGIALYRNHPDWPAHEHYHAVQVLGAVLADMNDYAALGVLYPEAIELAQQRLEPEDLSAVSSIRRLAKSFYAIGMRAEAKALCAQAIARYRAAIDGGDFEAANKLAWLLATCSDNEIRDGREAITLAERAANGSGGKDPNTFDTLAAAHASVGNFAEAIRFQQQAIDLLRDSRAKEGFLSRLKRYEANQPWLE